MGRLTYVPFSGTLTAANGDYDLVEVLPGDDKPCKLRGFGVGQISEVGDAQEEILDLRVLRMTGTITSGSGGSAGAPYYPDHTDDAVAEAYTVEVMNTAVATTSGSTHELAYPLNVRSVPFVEWFPEERFALKAKQTEGLFLRLSTAVADDVSIKGWVCIEEE